jgi:hypothetical protein
MRRTFTFLAERTEDGLISHDRDEVRQALLDLEGAVFQLGGVVTMSAIREQTGPDAYETTGVVMAYDSFSPARETPSTASDDAQPSEEPVAS